MGRTHQMLFALLPAAGRSERMDRPKLLLPFGAGTVLEAVILGCRSAGVGHVLVVVSPELPQLAALATQAGASALLLPSPTNAMRETVEFGLRWIEAEWAPQPDDAWLLIPADHPTLEPAVIRKLLEAKDRFPQWSIFIPTYRGRRGHPALIGWKHVPMIRAFPQDYGLNAYLREQAAQTREVPVDQESILFDLDTPDDYAKLQDGGRASP